MNQLSKKDGFEGQRAIIVPDTVLASVCVPNPMIRQLYISDIGYYPNARHHHRQRDRGSRQHILIYCVSGKGWAKIDTQPYTISAGEIILLPANIPHEYKADENNPWTIYWVHFTGETSKQIIDLMLEQKSGHTTAISFEPSRLQLFEDIYANLENGYSFDNICYSNLCMRYFLASCLFDSNYNFRALKEKTDHISRCINYMQQNLDKMLSLSDIACAVNLSSAHIATLFKKKTGFSLIEYFNQLKTQKACQFLLFTDLRINEIADRLGIEDPYYFTRMFTKIMGVSPTKYRSRRRD